MKKRIRTVVLFATLTTLASCDYIFGKPEVRACEVFVKEALRSPSTYQRIDAKVTDRLFDWDEYVRVTAGKPIFTRESIKVSPQGLRTVLLSYEAANAFGTPVRGAEVCEFRTSNGRSLDSDELERDRD